MKQRFTSWDTSGCDRSADVSQEVNRSLPPVPVTDILDRPVGAFTKSSRPLRGRTFVFLTCRPPPSPRRKFSNCGYGFSVDGPLRQARRRRKFWRIVPKTNTETLFSRGFCIYFSVNGRKIFKIFACGGRVSGNTSLVYVMQNKLIFAMYN